MEGTPIALNHEKEAVAAIVYEGVLSERQSLAPDTDPAQHTSEFVERHSQSTPLPPSQR